MSLWPSRLTRIGMAEAGIGPAVVSLRPATASIGRAFDARPDLVALLAIAAAWPAFLVVHASAGAGDALPGSQQYGSLLAIEASGLPGWIVMSAAMMLPLALPAARHVGVNSLRRRRHRAVATFLGAFLALWALAGMLGMAALFAWRLGTPPDARGLLLPAALGLAAAWQLMPWKARGLRACARPLPLPPSGWKATLGCARFGASYGAGCVRSCWALMLVMAAAGGAHVLWTLALSAFLLAERRLPVVRLHPAVTAAALAATGLAIAALPAAASPPSMLWFCAIPR